MTRRLLLLCMLFSCASLFAQKVRTVSAEYTYYAPESMSVEEAKRTALDRAKLQAIADEFGTVVSQSTSAVISNANGTTDSQFYSVGGSDVRGEWIETVGNPKFDISYTDNLLVVSVRVKGKIREIRESKGTFIVEPLRNGLDRRFHSSEFKTDDEFHLFFQSPRRGYISVWLTDNSSGIAYRLIPYQRASGALYAVEANREYIFFSPEKASAAEYNLVDEMIMSAESDVDFNDIYVVFSPQEYTLPPTAARDGLKYADIEKFHKWLADLRVKNNDVNVSKTTLTVRKKSPVTL